MKNSDKEFSSYKSGEYDDISKGVEITSMTNEDKVIYHNYILIENWRGCLNVSLLKKRG